MLLDEVRSALRVDGNEHDAEIQGLIDAALADLTLSGVSPEKAHFETTDPLIRRAVVIYCQAHFDYADQAAPRLEQSYEMLKRHLTLSEEYRGGGSS
ncbi:head-tail connector protein [Symbiobacterium terraclitae]|uniref:head-tail connector protein n=1 Tax=Symbiobacterium terraclitae TaxID=557451 RepID=UPI0035B4FD8A